MMEEVSRGTLESIVSHFQTLFDTPKVSGIFPRMNEVYRTLGEGQNVQNTLKNLLGLSEWTFLVLYDELIDHLNSVFI